MTFLSECLCQPRWWVYLMGGIQGALGASIAYLVARAFERWRRS